MRAPTCSSWAGVSPLTVACVPTGMNMGVSTGPCGVCKRPRRAAPSEASNSKVMAIGSLQISECRMQIEEAARSSEDALALNLHSAICILQWLSVPAQRQAVLAQLLTHLGQRRLPEVLGLQQLIRRALHQVAER